MGLSGVVRQLSGKSVVSGVVRRGVLWEGGSFDLVFVLVFGFPLSVTVPVLGLSLSVGFLGGCGLSLYLMSVLLKIWLILVVLMALGVVLVVLSVFWFSWFLGWSVLVFVLVFGGGCDCPLSVTGPFSGLSLSVGSLCGCFLSVGLKNCSILVLSSMSVLFGLNFFLSLMILS